LSSLKARSKNGGFPEYNPCGKDTNGSTTRDKLKTFNPELQMSTPYPIQMGASPMDSNVGHAGNRRYV
jgi:hypothetical protein